MAFTIQDCLSLPSLNDAQVLAGAAGLSNTVEYITVVECADVDIIHPATLRENELVISALIALRDNGAKQCELIRHLKKCGEVGLIIFHTGLFMPDIDQNLLDTADELDFPLILIPSQRYYLRFSDVIYEVMEAILDEKLRRSYFVTDTMERIAKLESGEHNMETVLELLAEKLHCPLLLTDRNFQVLSQSLQCSHEAATTAAALVQQEQPLPPSTGIVLQTNWAEQAGLLYCQPVQDKNRRFYLLALSPTVPEASAAMKQAVEVIRLFISMWHYDYRQDTEEELLRVLLDGIGGQRTKLLKKFRVDLSSIGGIWLLRDRTPHVSEQEGAAIQRQQLALLKLFLQERQLLVAADLYQDDVVAILKQPSYVECGDENLPELLFDSLAASQTPGILFYCDGLNQAAELPAKYQLLKRASRAAQQIFPYQRIYTEQHLIFADRCQTLAALGQEAAKPYLEVLERLHIGEEPDNDLLSILETMLLDTQMNTAETANLLFLHRNTVYYRLRRIRQILGCDPFTMPTLTNMYLALALRRLLQ